MKIYAILNGVELKPSSFKCVICKRKSSQSILIGRHPDGYPEAWCENCFSVENVVDRNRSLMSTSLDAVGCECGKVTMEVKR